jgi:hypothetical protein
MARLVVMALLAGRSTDLPPCPLHRIEGSPVARPIQEPAWQFWF